GGRTILPGFVDAHTHAFASTFWNRPPPDSEAEALDWLRTTQEAQLSVGITTQAEAPVPPGLVDRLRAPASAGDLHSRPTLSLRRTGNCIDIFDDLDGFAPLPDTGLSPRIPGIKIFADGAGNNPCGYAAATSFEQLGHDPSPFFGDLLFD